MQQKAFSKHISFKSPSFLLLVLGAAVIAIHLTLTFKLDTPDRQISSVLFWLVTIVLLWEKRDKLNFQTGPLASLLGALLLSLLLIKSREYGYNELRVGYPFIAGIALAQIASGFRGLQSYWRELALLFFAGVPEILLDRFTNPSPLAAQFANSILWYSGFEVKLQGTFLQLPGGAVQVVHGCSGFKVMAQSLGMSVLFLMLLPLPWKWFQKLILPVAAVAIGFIVNALRIALLAILVSRQQMAAFDYWHEGSGSVAFSAIAIILLVLLVRVLIAIFTPKSAEAERSAS